MSEDGDYPYWGVWYHVNLKDSLSFRRWLFWIFHFPKFGETTIQVMGWRKTRYYRLPRTLTNV